MTDVRVWHDEAERWKRTGHLDQGPCWCPECIANEPPAIDISAFADVEIIYNTDPLLTDGYVKGTATSTVTFNITRTATMKEIARIFGIPIHLLRRRHYWSETPHRTAMHAAYDRRRRARGRRRRNR